MTDELIELRQRLMPQEAWQQQIGRLRRVARIEALLSLPFDTMFTVQQTAAMLDISRQQVWQLFFLHDWDLEDRGAVLTDADDAAAILGDDRCQEACMAQELECEIGGEHVSIPHPGGLFLSKSAVLMLALYLALDGDAGSPRILLDKLLLQAGYRR